MRANQVQSEIEKMHYWDARVLQLESSFFGDEILIVFEDTPDRNIKLLFTGCSRFLFQTSVDDRLKPIRELTKPQIHYFMQNVEISDILIDGENLLKCNVSMPPLNIEIVCSHVAIERV